MSFQSGFIAVVGRPNVGKSTLINELIGQKLSITSHKPQTTRHRIHAIDTQTSYQMIFVDTPGIHIGKKKAINSYMNKTASSSISEVDMILWLVEALKWTKEDQRVMEHLTKIEAPIILCVNKIDNLNTKDEILPYLENLGEKFQANEVFPLSAFNKNHTNDLRKVILKYLPQQKALFESDYVTDRSQRFVVAEFIREKLIRNLSNELPYDLTVEIEKFDLDGQMYRIAARIFVEKPSQKSIVIGNKGKMLKQIGEESRISIEGFLERKVFLELWVKVRQGWSNDKRALASLGYD
jgi:GTP-binding protein Era